MNQKELTPRELQEMYATGNNITEILRMNSSSEYTGNTEYSIEVAYDLQTGSYTERMSDKLMKQYIWAYTEKIADIFGELGEVESILEAGVGEATILSEIIRLMAKPSVGYYGFDLSWSRVAYARQWLLRNGHNDVRLCTGSLMNMPFVANSIDIVFTSHAIEPNLGREREILEELYRVTNKYLVLIEPCYESAGSEAKIRMEKHGYCRNLKKHSEELGYSIIRHEPFLTYDELNPTALTIIHKSSHGSPPSPQKYACPRYKTPLKMLGGAMYSDEALSVYPIIDGIPCLRVECGIIASKFPEIIDKAIMLTK